MTPRERVQLHLRALHLPTAARVLPAVLALAQRDQWSLEACAAELLERELEGRRQRRIERLLRAAHLPPDKTLTTLDPARLPRRIRRLVPGLCAGDFVDRAENLLIFGLPGRGKTHLAATIGRAEGPARPAGVVLPHLRPGRPAAAGQARPGAGPRAAPAGPLRGGDPGRHRLRRSCAGRRWRCSSPFWRSATSAAA